jgi:Pentapeptide repeats (8 copies)
VAAISPAKVGRAVAGYGLAMLTGAFAAGHLSERKTDPAPAPCPQDDTLKEANDRIREAAKWLIASAAAVAAALIAGSQLSSIGKLPVAWPTSVDDSRLWVAGLGAVLALAGVAFIIWCAARLFLPVTVTLKQLDEAWKSAKPEELVPVADFFRENVTYLQGFDSPGDLIAKQVAAEAKLKSVDDTGSPAYAELVDLNCREATIADMAQHVLLLSRFKRALRKMAVAAAAAALGILCFAWAANPPDAPTPELDLQNANLAHASLRGVDLSHADLDGADLTGADLTGAKLLGASTDHVIWSGTTCPDKTNSDDHGKTCAGHLRA